MTDDGTNVLHRAAVRIVSRWLAERHIGVVSTGGRDGLGGAGVDLTFAETGVQHRVKVKADPYFGTDPRHIGDHGLGFYRANHSSFALEAIADTMTKQPGWVFNSGATDLYYYFLAISQPVDEVRALTQEPDDVFFSELAVERDELVILPMRPLSEWFEQNYERYPTRPVRTGGGSAWYRLVPRGDLESAVPGVSSRGSIFPRRA